MITVAITRQLSPPSRRCSSSPSLLGVLYPAASSASAWSSPGQANGSLVEVDGKVVGSSLLGQSHQDPQWFQARPSASRLRGDTSGGSNLGPTPQDLATAVAEARGGPRRGQPGGARPTIPPDALTASGSGLDPHISPAYAAYQVAPVAAARGLPTAQVQALIDDHTEGRLLWASSVSDRVNVTELNLALAGAAG